MADDSRYAWLRPGAEAEYRGRRGDRPMVKVMVDSILPGRPGRHIMVRVHDPANTSRRFSVRRTHLTEAEPDFTRRRAWLGQLFTIEGLRSMFDPPKYRGDTRHPVWLPGSMAKTIDGMLQERERLLSCVRELRQQLRRVDRGLEAMWDRAGGYRRASARQRRAKS